MSTKTQLNLYLEKKVREKLVQLGALEMMKGESTCSSAASVAAKILVDHLKNIVVEPFTKTEDSNDGQ